MATSRANVLLLALVVICAGGVARAEDFTRYVPLQVGDTRVQAYLSFPKGELHRDDPQWERAGVIRSKVVGKSIFKEKEYFQIKDTYENVFGVPGNVSFQRVDKDGAYTFSPDSGQPEYMFLKFPILIGQSWRSTGRTARIAQFLPYSVPAGKFEDCVKVVEVWDKKENVPALKSESVYCAGVGQVYGELVYTTNGSSGQKTVTRLVRYDRADDRRSNDEHPAVADAPTS